MQDAEQQFAYPIRKAEIAGHLAEKYPHLFLIPVPLKIGIRADLLAAPDRAFSGATLASFLHKWVGSPAYCERLRVAKFRYDLAGNMVDVVTNCTRGDV